MKALKRPLPMDPESLRIRQGMRRGGNDSSSTQGLRIVSENMTSTGTSGTGSGTASGNGSGNGSGSGTGSGNDTCGMNPNPNFAMVPAASQPQRRPESNFSGDKNAHVSLVESSKINMHSIATQSSYADGDKARTSDHPMDSSTQERLAIKKRKRMDKRREYEEEVQRQLHTSSDSSEDSGFKPGEYISMEDSLSFSNTAR